MSAQKTYIIDLNALDWNPDWPTQLEIVARHQVETGKLRLLDDWGENEQGELWVNMPAWVIELSALRDDLRLRC